jgi:hypothetical protein
MKMAVLDTWAECHLKCVSAMAVSPVERGTIALGTRCNARR